MSIAVTGAVLIGQWPEAAMVMFLFNVAELIEARSLDRARNAIRGLLDLEMCIRDRPYPFALMSAPYGLRQAVDLLEFTERIHLTPSLTTNSLRVLKQYAISGAGVTLMPDVYKRQLQRRGRRVCYLS